MAKKANQTDARDLRDINIIAAGAAGKTQTEIAGQYGLRRETVNRILNSTEAKRLVDQAKGELVSAASLAVETLIDAMRSRHENMGVAVKAAIDLLKGVGALTEKTEITLMKPFVYQDDEGTITLGHKPVDEEEE